MEDADGQARRAGAAGRRRFVCDEYQKTCQRDQKKSGECDTDQSESDRDTDGEL